jgi:hypothetical protein
MDAAAAKAPAPKMQKRAIFSRVGRWMDRRVLYGSPKIQMSVMMLKVDVAEWSCQYLPENNTLKEPPTVEECSRVDATSLNRADKIPHLLQWPALQACD